jgi:uncharacterized HAD superfamily protein
MASLPLIPHSQIVTVDIDSTLADTRHRVGLIDTNDREATDWLAYAKACADDEPTDVIALLRLLDLNYGIVLVTSRPAGARSETETWLALQAVPYDALVMNESVMDTTGRYMDATEHKVAALRDLNTRFEIVLHIDDWWQTAEAVKDQLGIPVVVVRVYDPRAVELVK